MKTLRAFITDMAAKAGIAPDDKQLTDLLAASPETINVPDELISGFENNMVSIDQAKNNHPIIKSHYNAATYDGVNAEIDRLMNELQMPDPVKLVIANEKLATKRIGLLANKLLEIERAKKNTDDKGEKQSLQTTINELQTEIRAEKDKLNNVEKAYAEKETNLYKQNEINDLLAEYTTVFDKMPKSAKYAALNALINQTLQDKNAEIVLDESRKPKLVRKDGSNVFGDDNRVWSVKTLFDHALSSNNALSNTKVPGKDDEKKTGTNNNNPRKNTVIEGDNNDANTNKKNGSSQVLSNLLETAQRELEEADKPFA